MNKTQKIASIAQTFGCAVSSVGAARLIDASNGAKYAVRGGRIYSRFVDTDGTETEYLMARSLADATPEDYRHLFIS